MTESGQSLGRVAVLATGHRDDAEQAARRIGIEPVVVLTGRDVHSPSRFRALLRNRAVDTLVVHARSWERAPNPHLFMAAAAAAPVRTRILLCNGEATPFSRLAAATWIPRLAFDAAVEAPPRTLSGVARLARRRAPVAALGRGTNVLVIWRGAPENVVGGSITHISGIVAGLRELGLSVSVASAVPPPSQLADLVDDVEIVLPLRSSLRLTRDVEGLALDARLYHAACRLARRSAPLFIYQRHDAFITSGVDAAARCGVPLLLEWNGSEVWTRRNWHHRPLQGLFDHVVARAERRSALGASLVAAVSEAAAEMAERVGVPSERVIVSPNAVDLEVVDRATSGVEPSTTPTIGWVGSFGVWHGAPVLVRAFARLAPPMQLVLIGDGPGRDECRRLAQDLGVEDRIEWCGTLPHHEALRRLAECNVLASPHVRLPDQVFFGSPTKIFEYMALERPIVASGLDQIGELLVDGVTARLVTPGDHVELAAVLASVLADPAAGRRVAAAARREVEAQHTWRARADSIVDGLERVCSRACELRRPVAREAVGHR